MIKVAEICGYGSLGSGTPRIVTSYCSHITNKEFQFDFFLDDNSPYKLENEISHFNGRTILAPSVSKPFAFVSRLTEIFRQNRYDIVHAHLNTLNLFPLLAAKRAGIPVRIAHNHTTTGAGKQEFKRNLAKYALRPCSEFFATHLAACSDKAGKWIYGNTPFTLFHNAVDTKKYAFDSTVRETVRQELGLSPDTLALGLVGRFAPQKNHDFLLRVYGNLQKRRPDIALLLIGDGVLEAEAKELAQKLNLRQVFFLGARSDTERYYQAMDMFVMPSLYEGLPVVGIEAQTAGLPCFFSDRITRETGVTELANFLPLESEAEKWAATILSKSILSQNRQEYAEKVCDAGFDIRREAIKLQQFYEEVVQ